jgi:hypothetical protein
MELAQTLTHLPYMREVPALNTVLDINYPKFYRSFSGPVTITSWILKYTTTATIYMPSKSTLKQPSSDNRST